MSIKKINVKFKTLYKICVCTSYSISTQNQYEVRAVASYRITVIWEKRCKYKQTLVPRKASSVKLNIRMYSGPSILSPPTGLRKCGFILQVVLK